MLNQLKPVDGARHPKKRVGRGIGSGLGKTAGKGSKGQNSRAGGGTRPGFEGGQLPLFQRLPKRGFHNVNRVVYSVINLEDLNCFVDGTVVNQELLVETGLIKNVFDGVKVLGQGELKKKLTVQAKKFSAKALEGIQAAGGVAEVI